jgi:hypothetical protein
MKVSEKFIFKIMARCAIYAEKKGTAKIFPKYIVTPCRLKVVLPILKWFISTVGLYSRDVTCARNDNHSLSKS